MTEEDLVRALMTTNLFTLSPSRRTIDALELMVKKDIGSVPIVQKGKLVGIITERDIVRKITKSFDYLNRPLGETGKKPVITVTPRTPIWEAFEIMLRNDIRRLPVLSKGKLVGIITEKDLFKWVVGVVYSPNIPREIARLLKNNA
jgi:CBS domain-containing protein